jgi:hypothetical protein
MSTTEVGNAKPLLAGRIRARRSVILGQDRCFLLVECTYPCYRELPLRGSGAKKVKEEVFDQMCIEGQRQR